MPKQYHSDSRSLWNSAVARTQIDDTRDLTACVGLRNIRGKTRSLCVRRCSRPDALNCTAGLRQNTFELQRIRQTTPARFTAPSGHPPEVHSRSE
jgi:hypothetical protein